MLLLQHRDETRLVDVNVTDSQTARTRRKRLTKIGWTRPITRVYKTEARCRRQPLSTPVIQPAGPCTKDDRGSIRPTGASGVTSRGQLTLPEIFIAVVASGSERRPSVNASVRELACSRSFSTHARIAQLANKQRTIIRSKIQSLKHLSTTLLYMSEVLTRAANSEVQCVHCTPKTYPIYHLLMSTV